MQSENECTCFDKIKLIVMIIYIIFDKIEKQIYNFNYKIAIYFIYMSINYQK